MKLNVKLQNILRVNSYIIANFQLRDEKATEENLLRSQEVFENDQKFTLH